MPRPGLISGRYQLLALGRPAYDLGCTRSARAFDVPNADAAADRRAKDVIARSEGTKQSRRNDDADRLLGRGKIKTAWGQAVSRKSRGQAGDGVPSRRLGTNCANT